MIKEPKIYEIAYHLNPDLTEEKALEASREILNFIGSYEGEIKEISEPQKRKLAYPINHFRHSYFGWATFHISPAGLENLKAKLKYRPEILRYLIITFEKLTSKRKKIAAFPKLELPMLETPVPKNEKTIYEKEKIGLEELDKKLEEILK
ncbi:MAG: 30S ribosomal protein S6 [Parcubacteria group bacterium]|nr:30S ribosomal protein S6 [Parcubacteria group bacterium]